MLDGLIASAQSDAAGLILAGFFGSLGRYALILLGFSLVIFFHEVGHFMAAKACKVRVDKFAIGFGKELFGFGVELVGYFVDLELFIAFAAFQPDLPAGP